MRFAHPGGGEVHLGYCSNVHAAEDVDGVIAQLARFAVPVREQLGASRLGVGLWLTADGAAQLRRDDGALARLRAALADGGLEVVTFNAFPYRAFHAPVVKAAVYEPNWTDPARFAYTVDVAWICAQLLPDDVEDGSISTVPLGWHAGWSAQDAAGSRARFGALTDELAAVQQATGRTVRVGIEPEPSCVVETIDEAIDALAGADPDWLGISLDACHHAVLFEDPATALAALERSGTRIVKCQLSSALRATEPRSPAGEARLREFVEPRFLHQTRERVAATGTILPTDDLPEALDGALPGDDEWRVHFHVPVSDGGPETTQDELVDWMRALLGGDTPLVSHLEIETYTWSVLPEDRRPVGDAGLIDGLAREVAWTRDRLTALGLQEITS